MTRIKNLRRHTFVKINKDNPIKEIYLDKSVNKIKNKVSTLIYFFNNSKLPKEIHYSIQYINPNTGEDIINKGCITEYNSDETPFIFEKQIEDKLMYKLSFSVKPQIDCEFTLTTEELLK